jgi:hypothetical protein
MNIIHKNTKNKISMKDFRARKVFLIILFHQCFFLRKQSHFVGKIVQLSKYFEVCRL